MPPSDPFRKLLAELKRRRVLEVVAIYAGLSFALLQGADVVIGALPISPIFLTALTILVLLGFPVAIIVGWVYDVDKRGRILRTPSREPADDAPADATASSEIQGSEHEVGPRLTGWPARSAAVLGIVALVAASWFTASRILPVERAQAMPDPRGSYLVLPIHTRSQTAEDAVATERAARRLTRQLRGWDSVRVVQSFALGGLMSRLGIDETEAATLEQAFEMAEAQGVGTLIGLSLETRGDEADLEAVMYDVFRRREIGQPTLLTGSATDLDSLVAPVALGILQLRDQSARLEDLRSESRNPLAHRDFEDGLDALHDWRLEAAENHFREALSQDSLFASAHHYLSLTLYWQTSRDPSRILAIGPEIARLTQTANRLAATHEVRPGLRPHMAAFRAFWRGDYDEARRIYGEVLQKDPSDTEAWLLLGAVEYNDPVLREVAPDSIVPRSNLNAARRAFETAALLSPDWQISYGLLFEIDRMLAASALGQCQAFERPGAPFRAAFERVEAGDQVPFCPVAEDSIVWVSPADMNEQRRRVATENVERIASNSRRLLESWASIHPDQARPHDELADWLAWRRSTLGCKADPAVVRDLTSDIFTERVASLRLRADTTRQDLIRLAVMHMATDDVSGARSLMERALAGVPRGTAVPGEAANVLLALGLARRVVAITEPLWSTMSFAIRDPEGEGPLGLGDVKRSIAVLGVYGATSLTADPEIAGAFQDLFATWSRQSYSPRQAAYVRRAALAQGIAPALALYEDGRGRWFEGWTAAGLEIPAVWRGFLAADSATGSERQKAALNRALDEVLADLEDRQVTTLDDHYLAAILARTAGRHRDAVDQLLHVETCPLSLIVESHHWGLRTLGRWHRAQSYFVLGDSIRGREALAGYSALRADVDPVVD